MNKLFFSLYSWDNGAIIMIGVFALVIIGIIAAVMLMMNSDKKKKND
ncbi:hypothetical protein [Flavobacterium orientale]|nr:hypothetical protein [Flavobacterium orientale]